MPPKTASGEWQPFATAIDLAFIDRVIHGCERNPNTVALAAIFRDYAKKGRQGIQCGRGQISRFAQSRRRRSC